MSILKNIFKFSISTWVNFVVSTVAVSILTRTFAPAEYAIIALFTTATEFGMSFFCMGMDSACLRFYNTPPNDEPKNLFIGKIIIACTFFIVSTGLASLFFNLDNLSLQLFSKENKILILLLFINLYSSTLFRFFNISYRMETKTKEYNIQMILTNTIRKLSYVLAVFVSPNAETAILIQVLLLFGTLVFYFFKQHNSIFPSLSTLKTLRVKTFFNGYGPFLKFAIYSAPTYWLIYANNYLSLFLIGKFCSASAVGIFSTATFFSAAMAVMRGGFATFWGPYMYNNYQTEQKTIIKVHGLFVLFSAVCFSLLLIFKDVIYLLIGSEYYEGKTIMSYVLLSSILQSFLETTVYGIYIEKKAYIATILLALQLASNAVLSLALTPKWGIQGAAYAMLISNVLYFALSTYWGQKYYKSIKSALLTTISIIALIVESILVNLTDRTIMVIIYSLIPVVLIMLLYKDDINSLQLKKLFIQRLK